MKTLVTTKVDPEVLEGVKRQENSLSNQFFREGAYSPAGIIWPESSSKTKFKDHDANYPGENSMVVFAIKALAILALTLTLTGCLRDSEDNLSIEQSVARAEANGELPQLDYSEELAGSDENQDGVRDDLGEFFASNTDSDMEMNALMQSAKSVQTALLVDEEDPDAVRMAVNEITKSVTCISEVFSPQEAERWRVRVESMVTNTMPRLNAYSRFNKAASGNVFSLPARENSCE